MANSTAPFGFLPVGSLNGAPVSGSVRRYKKEAAVILAPGDPVVLTGTSEAVTGIPLVTRAVGTEGSAATITGIIVAIDPNRGDLSKKHMASADTGYLLVDDDPESMFVIKNDGTMAVTDIGQGANMTVTNANTVIGKSQVVLSTANVATGTQLRILELAQREDNAVGLNADVVVKINNHTYAAAGTLI